MECRICSACKLPKPVDEFAVRNDRIRADGTAVIQGRCNECIRDYKSKHYVRNKTRYTDRNRETLAKRLDLIDALCKMLGGACNVCGEDDPVVLDFHHLNPAEKEGAVKKLARTAALKTVIAEMKKCVLLCSNCHRKLHGGKLCLLPDTKQAPDVLDGVSLPSKSRRGVQHVLVRGERKHGTQRMYRAGCKCDLCRKANSEKCMAARIRKWGTKSSKPPKEFFVQR